MTKKPKSSKKDIPFEKAMERLEAIVNELEEGHLDLDKSLASFEEGMSLARACEDKLSNAQSRVEKIMKNFAGKEKLAPLTEEDIEE